MSAEIITTISLGISLILAGVAGFGYVIRHMDNSIRELRAELKGDMADLRASQERTREEVYAVGQRVSRVEGLLERPADLAAYPTQPASESPERKAGVAEPKPGGAPA